MRLKTVAVILAAGCSTRMGFSKMTADLCGEPVISHTLKAFQNTDCVDAILLVARAQDKPFFAALCAQSGITKLCGICEGGVTRQQSAENSLLSLPADTDIIAVHDGARPLITPEIITRTVDAAKKHGAAAAAMPVKDTIKIADENRFIDTTPDRSTLWQVQTPQVFDVRQYKAAFAAADAAGLDLTDDCQLFEHAGKPIKLVEGSYQNLKITTPEDLILAKALLGV